MLVKGTKLGFDISLLNIVIFVTPTKSSQVWQKSYHANSKTEAKHKLGDGLRRRKQPRLL